MSSSLHVVSLTLALVIPALCHTQTTRRLVLSPASASTAGPSVTLPPLLVNVARILLSKLQVRVPPHKQQWSESELMLCTAVHLPYVHP
jgi:hypothetical protein